MTIPQDELPKSSTVLVKMGKNEHAAFKRLARQRMMPLSQLIRHLLHAAIAQDEAARKQKP